MALQYSNNENIDEMCLDCLNHFHDNERDSIESITIKTFLVGFNLDLQMIEYGAMELECDYFIDNNPNKWHADASNYNMIIYEEIRSGINLKYYENSKAIEYNFIDLSGADHTQITIQNKVAESLYVSTEGELVIKKIDLSKIV